jgi:hypothetical protein
VVITDFNVVRVAFHEAEANTPLVVDRYGVLAPPVASKGVESITGRCLQVIDLDHTTTRNASRDALSIPGACRRAGTAAAEAG